jgi:hypothetical protein
VVVANLPNPDTSLSKNSQTKADTETAAQISQESGAIESYPDELFGDYEHQEATFTIVDVDVKEVIRSARDADAVGLLLGILNSRLQDQSLQLQFQNLGYKPENESGIIDLEAPVSYQEARLCTLSVLTCTEGSTIYLRSAGKREATDPTGFTAKSYPRSRNSLVSWPRIWLSYLRLSRSSIRNPTAFFRYH